MPLIVKGGWNTVVGYRPQLARSGSGSVSALVLPQGNAADKRERFSPQPGPLHLTRRQDLLEVELEQPNLSVYKGSDTIPSVAKP
jgi:hypothetical protein